MLLLIGGAMWFTIAEPIQVLPRLRIAPGYALTSQTGSTITSESARGSVTLYSFAPSDCGDRCDEMHQTMERVGTQVSAGVDLGETDFAMITITLDPVDAEGLRASAAATGDESDHWIWAGSDDPERLRRVVGDGFQRFYEVTDDGIDFDPSFVLVDGNGVVRGDYRYSTLADDSEKLTRHIEILAEEIRNASGATALAYEAAHLFLCYP